MNENQFFTNLGANISSIRIKKGINQDDLATYFGLSRPSIVNIEKGKQKPSIYTLILIANYLMVDIKDLIPDLYLTIDKTNIIGLDIDKSIFSEDRDFIKFMKIISKQKK